MPTEQSKTTATPPSYHDLHITTGTIPRTSIFGLSYGLEVSCTRSGGWQLWNKYGGKEEQLAGEYHGADWIILDVAGHVICDSRQGAAKYVEDNGDVRD